MPQARRLGIGQCIHDRRELAAVVEVGEVEHAMETELAAGGCLALERIASRGGRVREANPMARFEPFAVLHADHVVLGVGRRDVIDPERLEELARPKRESAVADVAALGTKPPTGPDVVESPEVVAPRLAARHVSIPLDHLHEWGFDVPQELLQHEARIIERRGDRRDGANLDAGDGLRERRVGVGKENDAFEFALLHRFGERTRPQRRMRAVRADQRHVAQLHASTPGLMPPMIAAAGARTIGKGIPTCCS
jgi:hypothetical protein